MSVVSPILHNAPAMWCAGALHGLVLLVLGNESGDESQHPLCAASFPGEGVPMTARRFFHSSRSSRSFCLACWHRLVSELAAPQKVNKESRKNWPRNRK